MVIKQKKNTALKREIQAVLRKHKVKNMRHHLKHMEGSGLFDTLVNIGKKAVEYGKKGYDLYNKHKDTIHKVVDFGVKHAPKAIDIIKRIRGVAPATEEGGRRVRRVRRVMSKRTGAARPLGGSRKVGVRKPSPWIQKCKEYAAKHNCSYKEAMVALSQRK